MQIFRVVVVGALVGAAASLITVDETEASASAVVVTSVDASTPAPAPAPTMDEPQCTTRSDCPWGYVCQWGQCAYVDCGGLSTCQKGTEELACCTNGCSPSGGCAGDVPNPPTCPGWEVRCGSICCPYMYACLDANTGQCGINY